VRSVPQQMRLSPMPLRHSFFIGDHPHDVLTGATLGTFGLYLLTGHGRKQLGELPPDQLVFHTLSDAAAWIAEYPNHAADLCNALRAGADAIRHGGLVVYPTETVYGLGADASNPHAVARSFAAKVRPFHDPLIVHVSDKQHLQPLVLNVPEQAQTLIENFWPGPLTLSPAEIGQDT